MMFANSALARENYRKNETPMWFLHAKTSPVFRFFVGLTIIAFVFFTIVPMSLLAQEAATTTEEIINDQSEDELNDQLSIINDDSSATTTTEEIVNDQPEDELNDQLSPINDDSSDAATTTEEIINDQSEDELNDQLSIINDDSSATTTTEEIINDQSEDELNDQLSIINDDSSATTTTEEIVNDQLSIINDDSSDVAADSLIEIEFTNVYYGQVGEDQETIAPQITSAIVRNVGRVPAAVMIWQDDMGLGRGEDGRWNIQYGARAAGGEWIFYDPFEMVLLPEVLPAGESAAMEFSVRVLNFPRHAVASGEGGPEIAAGQTDYTGIMTINGVAAPQGDQSLPLLNSVLSDDSGFKAKTEEIAIPAE
jgi:predicted house-cleaning noncanonical NTP pyrophosphatase (MazG superfamily)